MNSRLAFTADQFTQTALSFPQGQAASRKGDGEAKGTGAFEASFLLASVSCNR